MIYVKFWMIIFKNYGILDGVRMLFVNNIIYDKY